MAKPRKARREPRRVDEKKQVLAVSHQMRIVERSIESAYEGMVVVLQVMPSNVEGGHAFLVRAVQIRKAIWEVWESLNQLCLDMGFSHTVAPKGGD